MFYSEEILNYYVFHFYIIRDVKKSKPVSCPSNDDIFTVSHQSENKIKYKVLTKQQNIHKDFLFPQEQFGTKTSGKPHMGSFSLKWL